MKYYTVVHRYYQIGSAAGSQVNLLTYAIRIEHGFRVAVIPRCKQPTIYDIFPNENPYICIANCYSPLCNSLSDVYKFYRNLGITWPLVGVIVNGKLLTSKFQRTYFPKTSHLFKTLPLENTLYCPWAYQTWINRDIHITPYLLSSFTCV